MSQYRETNSAETHIRGLFVKEEREKSYLLIQKQRDGSTVSVWIPKSQISYIRKHSQTEFGDREVDITIPDWLMEEKGLEDR